MVGTVPGLCSGHLALSGTELGVPPDRRGRGREGVPEQGGVGSRCLLSPSASPTEPRHPASVPGERPRQPHAAWALSISPQRDLSHHEVTLGPLTFGGFQWVGIEPRQARSQGHLCALPWGCCADSRNLCSLAFQWAVPASPQVLGWASGPKDGWTEARSWALLAGFPPIGGLLRGCCRGRAERDQA